MNRQLRRCWVGAKVGGVDGGGKGYKGKGRDVMDKDGRRLHGRVVGL